ncbi:MAG: M1 family metallopeptidase [Lacibacter sp.]
MKYLAGLFIFFISVSGNAQQTYWQQQVNFKIEVTLNDTEHTLDGFEKIEYINNSPDTLRFIWFHLWPNAYRTDKTAFSDQLLQNGRTDFYFSKKEDRGYINRLDFRVNNVLAETEDHPQHIDIIKVVLPQPLAPGNKIELTTPFHVQLPKNFSRGGHVGQTYQVTQWYPKPAVYDNTGWHPMPYLDQGEFYSEFGRYEVKVTVPKSYVVLSSGELQNENEKKWLQQRAGFSMQKEPAKKIQAKPSSKKPIQTSSKKQEPAKTLIFKQNNIHDFAWFAGKKYIVNFDTLVLNNRTIEIYSAYTEKGKQVWRNSTQMIKDAIVFRSKIIGEYQYNIASAVEAKMGFEGGMEYPCITSISPMKTEQDLESVIEHELGHNWFQGMLANNERVHPWMDEGINNYYDSRFAKETSCDKATQHKQKKLSLTLDDKTLLESFERWKKDQPLTTPGDSLTEANYGFIAYTKGSLFVQMLEQQLGKSAFDNAMQNYFQQWKMKHPSPADLKTSLEKSTGKNLDTSFALLHQTGSLYPEQKKKLKFVPIIGNNTSSHHIIMATPFAGFNMYDGLMPGVAVSNYTLPPTKFQFITAPVYAIESKQLNGIGRLSYTFHPHKIFQRVNIAVNAMKFSSDDFTDTANTKYITGFSKFSASLKLVLKENDPLSSRERFIQWKTFYFNENDLQFKRDTLPNGNLYTKINKTQSNRYLNQLRLVILDTRVLYPYKAEMLAEQAKDFIRLAFTGNYYFNYNDHLGADVRLFAGKFIYLGNKTTSKQFLNDAYHLNMSGPKGYEDYTYSNYYIGRNEFEGFASQQIMMRDGGFKVRTDMLANKVGKTDNWLAAINFTSDIPDQINILKLLPVKIPLKVFLDLGTYAEAWKPDANGNKVLYDAGLQLSLLKNTVNIYFPLLYSKVYRDYFNSTIPDKKFLKNIAFSIDIQNLSLKKIDRLMPF